MIVDQNLTPYMTDEGCHICKGEQEQSLIAY
jgi:hypothetical protein